MQEFEEAAKHNMENQVCWLMDADLAEKMYQVNWEIAVSYYLIPICLSVMAVYFWRIFSWQFKLYLIGFAAFIFICGTGHIVKVQNIFDGNFELEYKIDLWTARISELTALLTLSGVVYLVLKARRHKDILDKLKDVLILSGLSKLKK